MRVKSVCMIGRTNICADKWRQGIHQERVSACRARPRFLLTDAVAVGG